MNRSLTFIQKDYTGVRGESRVGQVMLRRGGGPDGAIERLTTGGPDGPPAPVIDALRTMAPPSADLAPHLLDLLPRTGEKGRYAVASLAVELAADPGYRPVVEAVVKNHPLDAVYRPWFLVSGTRLDGDALRWWLELVGDDPSTTSAVNYALCSRRDAVLSRDADVVVDHLLRTDAGPARHAADLAAEVLRRGGPCARVEAMVSRWIRDGRFDRGVDTADGGTSAAVLATCLERCISDGPFTTRWALVDETLAHWRSLLSADDPERHRRGLDILATLLTAGTSLAGTLPGALAPTLRSRPGEGRAIERGFAALGGRHSRRRTARIDDAIRACRQARSATSG